MTRQPAKRAKTTAGQSLVTVLTFVIGFADGLTTYMIYSIGLRLAGQGGGLAPAGCVIVGVFVGTLVHELGHVIAALIAGWRIVVFAVRPFLLQVPNARLAFADRQSFSGALGFVVAVPSGPENLTLPRWVVFIAGGPIASLLFAIYLAWLAVSFNHAATPTRNTISAATLCAGFAVHSFCVCLLTMLPRRRPGVNSSDGAKLLAAWSKTGRATYLAVNIWLQAMAKYKVRPRDLPDWMIRSLQRNPRDRPFRDAVVIGRVLDAKSPDYADARRRIDAFRAAFGDSEWACGCDAYVAAVHEGDTDRASRALAVTHRLRPVPLLTLAAKAALQARLGDAAGSKRYLAEMELALRQGSPFKDRCYADIRRNVEAVLRVASATSGYRKPNMRGSVPYHVE